MTRLILISLSTSPLCPRLQKRKKRQSVCVSFNSFQVLVVNLGSIRLNLYFSSSNRHQDPRSCFDPDPFHRHARPARLRCIHSRPFQRCHPWSRSYPNYRRRPAADILATIATNSRIGGFWATIQEFGAPHRTYREWNWVCCEMCQARVCRAHFVPGMMLCIYR